MLLVVVPVDAFVLKVEALKALASTRPWRAIQRSLVSVFLSLVSVFLPTVHDVSRAWDGGFGFYP